MLIGSGDFPLTEGNALVLGENSRPQSDSARPAFSISTKPLELNPSESPEPIVIAIIDTGIDIKAFKDLLWQNPNEIENGKDDDGNGMIDDLHGWDTHQNSKQLHDEHGHGTHIAGIIAAEIESQKIQGQKRRPIRLMILKYFDAKSGGSHTLQASLKAFRYAIDHGAHVINYSGGGLSPSTAEENLILEAADKNILVVAAAGNEGKDSDKFPFYPADYPSSNILSVGATDDNLTPVESSNYGRRHVDLTARGKSIQSTLPGGITGKMTGTSQATAFVTATAAMILSSENQNYSPEDLILQILSTGRTWPHLSGRSRSGQHLDTFRALTQKGSQYVHTGQRQKIMPLIANESFAAEPELHH